MNASNKFMTEGTIITQNTLWFRVHRRSIHLLFVDKMNDSSPLSDEEIEAQTYETSLEYIVTEMGFSYSKPLPTRVHCLPNLLASY